MPGERTAEPAPPETALHPVQPMGEAAATQGFSRYGARLPWSGARASMEQGPHSPGQDGQVLLSHAPTRPRGQCLGGYTPRSPGSPASVAQMTSQLQMGPSLVSHETHWAQLWHRRPGLTPGLQATLGQLDGTMLSS